MTSAAMMLVVCTLLFLACRSNAEGDTTVPAKNMDGGLTESKSANATGTMSQRPAINEVKPNSITPGKCLGDKCASDNDTSKASSETSGNTKSPTSDGASTTTGPKVTSEKNDSTSATESTSSTTTSTSIRAGTSASTVVTQKTVAPAANVTTTPAGNASGPSTLAASSDVLCIAVAIGALLWRAT